jgi:putative tricarboxylic transport membrane protein
VILLSLATIIFAAFVEKLGLLPGVFATTFVATLANRKVNLVRAALTSLCIAIFCTAVFAYGIRLPIPVIGEWLGG